MLNALSAAVPERDRIVTIEDAAELQLKQRHTLRLESRPKNIEGEGEVTIRDLVRNALRMRPDRIIVGEVRGAEALDMLQAMNTGHEGSLSTIHANSPRDAMSRLETMVLMAGYDLPLRAIRHNISSALDLIVQIERLDDGTRHVTAVSEVQRMEGEVITLQPLFEFKLDRFTEDGKVIGDLAPTGLRPSFLPQVQAARDRASGRALRHRRRTRCSASTASRSPDELDAGGRRRDETPRRGSPVRRRGGARRSGGARRGQADKDHDAVPSGADHAGRAASVPGAGLRDRPAAGSGDRREPRARQRERDRVRRDFTFSALSASNVSSATILAIDASDSMTGDPEAGALAAARTFVGQRRGNQEIGVVTFNGDVNVLQTPTIDPGQLQRGARVLAAARVRDAHLFDAVNRSLKHARGGEDLRRLDRAPLRRRRHRQHDDTLTQVVAAAQGAARARVHRRASLRRV